MIKETNALSLVEASEYIEDTDVKGFIKKFTKTKVDEAKKIREDIEKLENIKIKQEHIVKIIDLLPEDEQDLAKIFNEVSLDENEISKILEIVKKYK
jgi:DNA-directed RNA polymerase subunit F